MAAIALVYTAISPWLGLGFPGDGQAYTIIGQKIDHLFYVVLGTVLVTFIGTHIAISYVLWTGGTRPADKPAFFTHGSHLLEMIWTVVPGALLLFLSLYQMNVWAEYRIKTYQPKQTAPIAEVTARQFEWRIRYPGVDRPLEAQPRPEDLYTVNDLRVPANQPVSILLRTDDVQHAFFVPQLRIKQDAVPGLVIPIWFEVTKPGEYEFVCAELCGWGHYKMRARLTALPQDEFAAWKAALTKEQFDDGFPDEPAAAGDAE